MNLSIFATSVFLIVGCISFILTATFYFLGAKQNGQHYHVDGPCNIIVLSTFFTFFGLTTFTALTAYHLPLHLASTVGALTGLAGASVIFRLTRNYRTANDLTLNDAHKTETTNKFMKTLTKNLG